MKHLIADIYGVKTDTTNTGDINEIVNLFINKLDLKAVMPVQNVPYYYSELPEDGGVSSFCLLDCGHITIHTFPFYGDCFIDIMFKEIDITKARTLINDTLKPERLDIKLFDRDFDECNINYNPKKDFGPHVFAQAVVKNDYSIADIYDALEALPGQINMHEITRPTVITNRRKDYDIISGIVLIAESHISIHYNIKTKKTYLDIYSCKFCNPDTLYSQSCKILGNDCSYQLISRGAKHKTIIKEGYSLSNNGWINNI